MINEIQSNSKKNSVYSERLKQVDGNGTNYVEQADILSGGKHNL